MADTVARTKSHRDTGRNERRGQGEQPAGECGRGGHRGHQEGTGRVAEFAAGLGGAHGFPEPLGRCMGGQGSEPQRGGDLPAGPGAQRTRRQARQAGYERGQREADGGHQETGGHPEVVGQPGGVAGAPPRLCSAVAIASTDTTAPVSSGAQPGRGAPAVAARLAVGTRKPRVVRRRARPSTVCRVRGGGATVGTIRAAQAVTAKTSAARAAR